MIFSREAITTDTHLHTHIFPAHILPFEDGWKIQSVEDHCRKTAEYTAQILQSVGLSSAAYLAGLTHDAGKFCSAYRQYITRAVQGESVRRGSVNHTFTGVRLLLSTYHGLRSETLKDIACEVIAHAVGSHHGLFDCVDEDGKSGFDHRLQDESVPYEESKANFLACCAKQDELDTLFEKASSELTSKLLLLYDLRRSDDETLFYVGLLTRLLTSAVIEGDRRDTTEFMSGAAFPLPAEGVPEVWGRCLRNTEQYLKRFPLDSPIARTRSVLSAQCRAWGNSPGGIYRLSLPTGAGKTLSALRAALAHAEAHNKSRIIFTFSLLSILDQNTKVIRDAVSDDTLILEHHSNLIQEIQTGELDEKELLAENWSSPILITTLVQLLNTLFDGRPTCIRRFQALCNSVIVIDEVQTVPTKMLTLFNLALNFLAELCGSTILLCSATQPYLEQTSHPIRAPICEVVPYQEELWAPFRRTQITPVPSCTLDELPEFIQAHRSGSFLLVCNTKSEASNLYRALLIDEKYHLSASMCMAHRRDTLNALGQSLDDGRAPVCISTQVIEAGIDISFQQAARLIAGMDSILQTAGRCNRHHECAGLSPVWLLRCVDEQLPHLPDIAAARSSTEALLDRFTRAPEDFPGGLDSDDAIRQYYDHLYRNMDVGTQDFPFHGLTSLYQLLSDNLSFLHSEQLAQRYFLRQAFRTAGDAFQVFDSDTLDVLVPYKEGKELICKLSSLQAKHDLSYAKMLLEQAKPYTVSIFRHQQRALEAVGALFPCGHTLALDPRFYDLETGLTLCAAALELKEV